MKVACIGGGPAGLYLAIQLKRADPSHEVVVHERNRVDDPFGFGVVFSDATGDNLAAADPAAYAAMSDRFHHWDDIDIHYRGGLLTSTGHGFSGLSRAAMLEILARRAAELGADVRFGCEVTDPAEVATDADLVVACDGINSAVRARFADVFRPTLDVRPNRFVWLGTTRPFPAFTFHFKPSEHGLWRIHAYQYEGGPEDAQSTFIVEASEETWRATGLAADDEAATIAFCEELFADELDGHPLVPNRSHWRQFVTVRNEHWSHTLDVDGRRVPLVLIGDAAHTVHFSIGSGTKVAMEDAMALAEALGAVSGGPGGAGGRGRHGRHGGRGGHGSGEHADPAIVQQALAAYEAERRPLVESAQRAAQVSMQWFEETERFMNMEPLQFAFNLLTRSLRVTHDNLKVRDPEFVRRVDEWFARKAFEAVEGEAVEAVAWEVPGSGSDPDAHPSSAPPSSPARPSTSDAAVPPPPPLFTPYQVRDLVLENRVVVSPMCQYCADDGTPTDWHLVHLGSRAVGGAGLVMAEMTNISPEARISPGCTGLYQPDHATSWSRIVDFVHGNSRAKIGVQLGHAGRKGSTRLSWEGDCEPLEDGGWPIVAASAIPYFPHSPVPKPMDEADMAATLDDYIRAAELAEAAGFDWLELHCAHGYLLASFISPLTNRREDDYGGPLENRMRYPLRVFDAVRDVWPEQKPMSVRISAVDWKPGGVDSAEAVEIARLFRDHGCDIMDVSAGQTVADQRPKYGRQFQTPFSDRIRHETGMPTMTVGNISSFTDVNTILAAGRADLVLMARAHLWDPYWTRHAAYELGYDLPWPPQYSVLDRYTPRFT